VRYQLSHPSRSGDGEASFSFEKANSARCLHRALVHDSTPWYGDDYTALRTSAGKLALV